MNKSRTLILKTGLCGLALSSLFLLNNKAVVHADAVTDGSQSNAISWNSDSDAAQNVQNTQKADDNQQNAQSVQPSRVEMSTVSSVSAAPRTTNQNTAVQSPKISNINDAQAAVPVVINNPIGDKVHVHYIDSNGNAVDNSTHDYDIDATKTGQASYTVPNGYQLNYPDGKYTVSGGAFNGTNLKGNVWHTKAETELDYSNLTTGNRYIDTILKNRNMMKPEASVWYEASGQGSVGYPSLDVYSDHATAGSFPVYSYVIDGSYGYDGHEEIRSIKLPNKDAVTDTSDILNFIHNYTAIRNNNDFVVRGKVGTKVIKPAYDTQSLPVAFVDSNNNNIVGMIQNYSGKVGTTQNVNLTVPTGYKLADGASLPTSVTFANNTNPLLIKVESNGQTNSVQNPANNTINVNFVDQETHKSVGTAAIDLTKQQQGTNYYQTPNGWATDNNGRYDVGTPFSRGYLTITDDKGNNAQQLILNAKQAQDFFEAFRKGHDTDLSIQAHLPAIHPDEINLQDLAYNGVSTYDKENGDRSWENIVYNATKKVIQTETNRHMTDNYGQGVFDGYYGKITAKRYNAYTFTDNYHPYDASTNTVTVPVHKTNSFSFADNSGNVKSVNGNTVDVTLTKPQNVNPATDTRCQSQATRTIQINFPDGQIPVSYKDIVDSHGNLKQTVHFTRTATEDALTGNILQYGNWTSDNKDHNFIGFPERTLPRIPGYTLSIKPF